MTTPGLDESTFADIPCLIIQTTDKRGNFGSKKKSQTYLGMAFRTANFKTGILLTEWFPLPTITRRSVAFCNSMSRRACSTRRNASGTLSPCTSISRAFALKLCALQRNTLNVEVGGSHLTYHDNIFSLPFRASFLTYSLRPLCHTS
jgi:hypothetical protein